MLYRSEQGQEGPVAQHLVIARVAARTGLKLQPLIVQQQNLQHILRPPLGLLYWPGSATPLQTSSYEGWRLSVALTTLERRGIELSEHRLSPARLRQRLHQAHPLQPRPGAERDLAGLLLQLLPLCRNPGLLDQQLQDYKGQAAAHAVGVGGKLAAVPGAEGVKGWLAEFFSIYSGRLGQSFQIGRAHV